MYVIVRLYWSGSCTILFMLGIALYETGSDTILFLFESIQLISTISTSDRVPVVRLWKYLGTSLKFLSINYSKRALQHRLNNVQVVIIETSRFSNFIFRCNLEKNQIAITQYFPDKRLSGWYEIDGSLLGNKFSNKGPWNLKLLGYVQTLTIRRLPKENNYQLENPHIKLKAQYQKCKNLEMHIGNLAKGRQLIGKRF